MELTDEQKVEFVDKTLAALAEHFDVGQLHLSWMSDGNTKVIHRGFGNWYARKGLAHNFIERNIAEESADKIADALRPPE